MASTYSSNLKLELMGTGDQSGTWGDTTNTNLGTLLEQAIVGYTTQAITNGADTVLTISNGASSVARNYTLELTGSLSANRNLIVPAIQKSYIIYNNTTGGFAVTVKVTGQTGVTVANGKKAVVYNNGTDVVEVVNAPVSETGAQTLTNKTLTSPTINTPSITGGTLATATITTPTLSGGTINNTPIGGTTASTGAFTTLSASSTVSGTGFSNYLASPPAIGGTTPAAGTFTTLSDTAGNVRTIVVNSQTTGYTLVASDNGRAIVITTGGVTVPASVFSAGQNIVIVNNSGSNQTITQGVGATVYFSGVGTTGNRTLAAYGVATIFCIASNTFVATGSGLS